MIRTVFANLVQFEIIPEEKEGGQVAFLSGREKKSHWKGHRDTAVLQQYEELFLCEFHMILPVQKSLSPIWLCFHCKSVLALLKTVVFLSLKYS